MDTGGVGVDPEGQMGLGRCGWVGGEHTLVAITIATTSSSSLSFSSRSRRAAASVTSACTRACVAGASGGGELRVAVVVVVVVAVAPVVECCLRWRQRGPAVRRVTSDSRRWRLPRGGAGGGGECCWRPEETRGADAGRERGARREQSSDGRVWHARRLLRRVSSPHPLAPSGPFHASPIIVPQEVQQNLAHDVSEGE